MKKLFLLLFLLIFKLGLTQSYRPLLDSTSFWKIHCGGYTYYEVSGDTLITQDSVSFTNYKKVNVFTTVAKSFCFGYPPFEYFHFCPQSFVLMREDTVAKKVFLLFPSTLADSLVYDFSLLPGDLVKGLLTYGNLTAITKIHSIDSVLIGGNFHKRFNLLVFQGWLDSTYYKIIEGVGFNMGFLEPIANGASQLAEYCDNGQRLYPVFYNNCSPKELNAIPICENTGTLSGISSKRINIIPNPSQGIFEIQTGEEKIDEVEVHNLLGSTIYKTSGKNINLYNYPDGMYFLKIIFGRNTSFKKIIIEK